MDHQVWLRQLYAAYNTHTFLIDTEINLEQTMYRSFDSAFNNDFRKQWLMKYPPLLEKQNAKSRL